LNKISCGVFPLKIEVGSYELGTLPSEHILPKNPKEDWPEIEEPWPYLKYVDIFFQLYHFVEGY